MIEAYRVIRGELEAWSPEMMQKKEYIIFSKADIVDSEMLDEMVTEFEKTVGRNVTLTLSAGAYIRTDALKDFLLQEIPEKKREEVSLKEDQEGYLLPTPEVMTTYEVSRKSDPKRCHISERDDGDFDVTGERIEEIVRMTDTRYIDGLNRVYDVLEKL